MAKVPAADHTLRILSLLGRTRGPLPATAIATQLGIPRSSVYHLLAVMAAQGFVTHFPEERRWGLGASAFELASGYSRQQPLTRLGRPLLEALVDRLGESGHLAVLAGTDVLYVVEERAPRRPSLVTDVGVRLPARNTATGRALLAALEAKQLRAIYPDSASYAELRRVLEPSRRDGIAHEEGEVTPGLSSLGAAVRDASGWPVAALAITFDSALDAEPRARIKAEVLRTAAELERRLKPRS